MSKRETCGSLRGNINTPDIVDECSLEVYHGGAHLWVTRCSECRKRIYPDSPPMPLSHCRTCRERGKS